MIELIAWDPEKQVFNFYELIGNGQKGEWFYGGSLTVQRGHYDTALTTLKASFPGTSQPDADHAWLIPVKAYSDTLTIESLIKQNIIDEEFVSDVLAVDLANPLFSTNTFAKIR